MRSAVGVFRVATWSGVLIDELLSELTTLKSKSKDKTSIFQNIEQAQDRSYFRMTGEHHSMLVSVNDIQYSVDNYDNAHAIDIQREINQFLSFFKIINNTLKLKGVRRIGIVCEYQFNSKTDCPSKELIDTLTTLRPSGHLAKFQLQFERRHPIQAKTGIPDFQTDDFWNVIETYYDSEIDSEHSTQNSISAMFDVQRYYSPLLGEKFDDAVNAVYQRYLSEAKTLEASASTLGVKRGLKEPE